MPDSKAHFNVTFQTEAGDLVASFPYIHGITPPIPDCYDTVVFVLPDGKSERYLVEDRSFTYDCHLFNNRCDWLYSVVITVSKEEIPKPFVARAWADVPQTAQTFDELMERLFGKPSPADGQHLRMQPESVLAAAN